MPKYAIRLLILYFIVSFKLNGQAKDSVFIKRFQINIESILISSDNIGNVYAITAANEVIKYNNFGVEQFRFNNNTLGRLSWIDTSDPFNLLLYYPDFQTAILLDRTMNETVRFDFLSLGVPLVNSIALSNDNQIWYYDELDFKLKKINTEGKPTIQSQDLSLLLGQNPEVIQISALGNWVFINTTVLGLLIFDQFGQYHQSLKTINLNSFQLIDELVVYEKNGNYFQYNWQSDQNTMLPKPSTVNDCQEFSWQRNHLFIRCTDHINGYQF